MARVLDAEKDALILRLIAEGRSPVEISYEARCGAVAVRHRIARQKAEEKAAHSEKPVEAVVVAAKPEPEVKPETEPESPVAPRKYVEQGDNAEIQVVVDRPVKTLEDAVAYAEVDAAVWRVKSWECTSWEMVAKSEKLIAGKDGKEFKLKTPVRHHLWRVHLKLERLLPKPYLDATNALYERLASRAPHYILHPAVWKPRSPYFMEVDLFDAHFANLSWAPECRENDDLKIKEAIFANAIDDVLEKTSGYPVDEILFPLGNDLHHVDTLARTTTAGTPQDCDGRYPKMIEVTAAAVIAGVERMIACPTVRSVRMIYVPGNHDLISTLHLCREVSAWFRNCDRVSVDLSPTPRKYIDRGVCLFGYTHGENMPDGKLKTLPTIMAVEEPERWAKAKCREWKLGHLHTAKTYETMSSSEYNGVMIRRLRALSRTNAWHHKEGYVGNLQAAEVYLYSREQGFQGYFVAAARS